MVFFGGGGSTKATNVLFRLWLFLIPGCQNIIVNLHYELTIHSLTLADLLSLEGMPFLGLLLFWDQGVSPDNRLFSSLIIDS